MNDLRYAGSVSCFVLVLSCVAGLASANETSAENSDQVAYGRYLSSQCVTCHQPSGIDNGIPSIVGWEIKKFVDAVGEYRANARQNQIMQTIANSLSEDEINALAVYFGSLKSK